VLTRFGSYVALALMLAASTALLVFRGESLADRGRDDVEGTAARVDEALAAAWQRAGDKPAPPADALLIARRLSLALTGTLPSLEEQRALERLPENERVDRHLDALLSSRRFADYWAERLARAFVGTDDGPFLVFRRRRFVYWLSDELAAGTPYDRIVQKMVAGVGLWTDEPATNFITAHERDPVRLAARSARAFLGMRLDCAQCHDHPFAHWKQADFEGLAAFYGGIRQTVTGIEDSDDAFRPDGRMMMPPDAAPVAPRVPFAESALRKEGSRRAQLAGWLTGADNPAFGKAIANRVWTMMVGKSLTGSVDDIESEERVPGVLDILGREFVAHGHDLRWLVRVVAKTSAFRAQSSAEAERFAAFPMTALRAEQIAGALVQLSSLHTIDADSHIVWRLMRLGSTNAFVERYGDGGDSELAEARGTMMQRLVLMNGRVVRERVEANLLSAAGRIAALAPDDQAAVRTAFRVCLTREPSEEELGHFAATLAGKKRDARGNAIEDLLWALVNTTEFSWNH
jgi:hypothetical protein